MADCALVRVAGGDWTVNVGLSVNHPSWVAMYAKRVAARLMDMPQEQWPSMDMRSTLQQYLQHHKNLLQSMHMWQGSFDS